VAAKEWLAERAADLLPVPYYHLVFTLPAPIADIVYQNKAVIYDLLFRASADTMLTIAADPKHLGARIGITAVLHTWGSAMTHHPHVHMIVPGGGIALNGKRWVSCRPGFFLPVRVLSRLFRRLFLKAFTAAHASGRLAFFGDHARLASARAFAAHLIPLRKAEWVVYAKRPFGGPKAVLAYLARYTHRVAITNSRLIAIDGDAVTFRWKDYRIDGPDRYKVMRLQAAEFIRRCPAASIASVTTDYSPAAPAPRTSRGCASCSVCLLSKTMPTTQPMSLRLPVPALTPIALPRSLNPRSTASIAQSEPPQQTAHQSTRCHTRSRRSPSQIPIARLHHRAPNRGFLPWRLSDACAVIIQIIALMSSRRVSQERTVLPQTYAQNGARRFSTSATAGVANPWAFASPPLLDPNHGSEIAEHDP
jgi:Putative transposase